MARPNSTVLLALAGIVLASGGAWWFQNQAAKGEASVAAPVSTPSGGAPSRAPVAVEVTQVSTVRLQEDAQAVGTLRSRQSVTLRPETSGRVAHIAFQEGAKVRKGQLLIQLDDTLQKAELSQAQAQLSIARANLTRNQELVAERFVAQRVVDESLASLQVAQAQVALAEARLARMRLVAPFDATVGLRSVSIGDYVKDGADLVNLEDTSQLTVDFRLPERYQSRTTAGQRVLVQLDALPGKDYEARILAVDPLIDANGRSLAVRATMAPTSGELRPGMFARLNIVFSVNEAAMMIPEEAIVPQGGRQFVVMLQSEGEGEAARLVSRRVEVKLGVRRGAQVEVLSGLKPGNTIVLAGQQRLQRDGTPVQIVDMNQSGGRPEATSAAPTPAAPAGSR